VNRRTVVCALVVAMVASVALTLPTGAAASGGGFSREIPSGGTTSLQAPAQGIGHDIQWPEFPGQTEEEGGPVPYGGAIVDRSQSHGHMNGPSVTSGRRVKSNPTLGASFDGLDFFQQRFARGGNQFSVEPPDQGLCVGNGYVMESVNSVVNVYDTSGNSLLPANPVGGAVDINTFYGYPPAINRGTLVRGPFVTDPSCLFDKATQRWFQLALTLDTFPNGAFSGPNHLDLAVSNTSSPLGSWTIYRIPVQDDGTAGTPNHHCSPGTNPGPTNPNACLGDYPHIGADANGVYLTTNEYDFFGPNFHAAQIYAMSKSELASTPASITLIQLDTVGSVASSQGTQPGFTVWPATSPGTQFSTEAGGTEYFLSSNAAEEATGVPNSPSSSSNELVLWALSNTSSLGGGSPSITLSNAVMPAKTYGVPPKSNQKPGDIPLGTCLQDTTTPTPFGPGCWRFFFVSGGPFPGALGILDSNDTRMQQVYYANGKVWGALDTAVTVNGTNKAAVEWFVVKPTATAGSVTGKVALSGYLALANNNLTYPAVAVNASGRGVMAFTLVGQDNFPSAAYASIDAVAGVGDIHVAAAGAGPQDGFSEYPVFNPRARWGDYGAAVAAGSSIWIASEYIGQTCTYATYLASNFRCGNTRASLGNWATRISQLTP
jgi:hypothetical protein